MEVYAKSTAVGKNALASGVSGDDKKLGLLTATKSNKQSKPSPPTNTTSALPPAKSAPTVSDTSRIDSILPTSPPTYVEDLRDADNDDDDDEGQGPLKSYYMAAIADSLGREEVNEVIDSDKILQELDNVMIEDEGLDPLQSRSPKVELGHLRSIKAHDKEHEDEDVDIS